MNLHGQPPAQPNWKAARRARRYKLDARVSVTAERGTEQKQVRGRSSDISEGGLGATLAGDLHLEETVTIECWPPRAKEPLRVRAAVRLVAGFHYGFQFLSLSDEQRQLLKGLARTLPAAD